MLTNSTFIITTYTEDTTSPVVFTAYKTSQQQIDQGDVISFGGILTNIGDHYNPGTSLFTCPTAGLYFITSTSTSNDCETRTNIVLEGNELVSTRAETDGLNQGGNSAFVECTRGQRIWVEGRVDNHCIFGGEARFSTFSGILLVRY